MSWIAVAIGGGALIGGIASMEAGRKQSNAADRSADIQLQMYNQTRSDLGPYRNAGSASLAQLQGLTSGPNAPLLRPFTMQDFQESPAYQFNLGEGLKAINKGAAARQRFYAPATLQDIAKFSQGLASNEFQNSYNMFRNNQGDVYERLYGMAGMGQNAAAMTGNAGVAAARGAGESLMGGANARAAGLVGAANAVTGAAGDIYNNFLMNRILTGQTYGGGAGRTPPYAGADLAL